MLYKDLLKEVRSNLKEIRKEFKLSKGTSRIYNEFLLELKKLPDLSSKKKFYLGSKKNKPYLEWLNEELKTFLETPNIRMTDRKQRHKKSLESLMNNYDIVESEALKLIEFLNDDTIKRVLERGLLSSEQVAEIVHNNVSLRNFIKTLDKIETDELKGEIDFNKMSNTEIENFWVNNLRLNSGKWRV